MPNSMSLKTAAVVLTLSAISLAATPTPSPNSVPTEQNVLAKFQIAKDGDVIFLPVTFKGKEYSFVFDTGCTAVTFDSQFKADLGNPKKNGMGVTQGGSAFIEIFDAPQAFVGPLSLKDCNEVMCADLKSMGMMVGKPVSGIIGMNWLKKYVVQINFDEGMLYFLKSADTEKSQLGTELPISYNQLGWPVISGDVLDGVMIKYKVDFAIDSGANGSGTLERRIFRDILENKKVKTSQTSAQTLSGMIGRVEFRLDDISIGGSNYHGLIFDEGGWSLLGLDFLSRHIVTFDFRSRKMYLKAGKEFRRVDESNMSGLGLIRKDGQTSVYLLVYDNSPAQQAGIEPNDIILKVDDKDANTYSLRELGRLLRRDKQKVTMTIKRGNDINDVSFVLQRRI